MSREFNITGTCIPEMHYMVDTSGKINEIINLVEKGKYFTINRPRQYGKTTTLFLLKKQLINDYLVIRTSFEGIGDSIFASEESFCGRILSLFAKEIPITDKNFSSYLKELGDGLKNFDQVSDAITQFVMNSDRKVVLMIDEVDKSSDNQLFLNFLGMLRNKYLKRNEGEDYTFHSVILAGVHDVKNLKLKIRPDSEKKFNSPWNIAIDFKVNMAFNPEEIATMLKDYCEDKNVSMNMEEISERLYYYTGGYPFLVSKICKMVDEELEAGAVQWTVQYIDNAFEQLLKEKNVNFDDLIKNLENNRDLYELVENIILKGEAYTFNQHDPVIDKGVMYGILKEDGGKIGINNRVYEQIIYNYMASKLATTGSVGMTSYNFRDNFILQDSSLDMEKILVKFQQFMRGDLSMDTDKNIKVLYLSQSDVEKVGLTMEEIIEALEKMFKLKGEGRVEMPPKPGIHTRKDAFIHAMPAYIPGMNAAGMKWVSGYPENYKKGLPYITGLMIMNDPETGLPLAIMDCVWVTAKRTGAATAVAAKYLANPDSRTIGILGCGVQGESNLEALMVVQKKIETVFAYDIFPQKAESYIEKMRKLFPGLEFVKAGTPKAAVVDSDIIVTAGPILKEPEQIIEAVWYKEGAFASPVDFDSYWKPAAMHLSNKYCTDDYNQLMHYKHIGYFKDIPEIYADLGEIAAGKKAGRENDKERIMSANLGLALDDMATGIILYERARQKKIGIELPL